MKVLIDTHTLLWMASEPEKLSSRARAVCASDELFFSVAGVWDISIKNRIGRLPLPGSAGDYLSNQVRRDHLVADRAGHLIS
jgi:PIN domain nuclease of toxin-antitoxin system